MPWRDEDGKPLSGAQQKKKRAEQTKAGLPKMSAAACEAFEKVGQPPEEADSLLVWGRRILAVATWLLLTGKIDAQQSRAIKDMIAVIGMTHNRGKIEETTQRLEKALEDRRPQGAVQVVHGSTVAKTPNSRGMARAPRAVSNSVDEPSPAKVE